MITEEAVKREVLQLFGGGLLSWRDVPGPLDFWPVQVASIRTGGDPLAVGWYLRFSLSYRDVEELLQERGISVDHVTLWRWVHQTGLS